MILYLSALGHAIVFVCHTFSHEVLLYVRSRWKTTHLCSVFDILPKHKRYCYICIFLLSIFVTTCSIFLIFMFLKWEQKKHQGQLGL